jgi:hypothetical protein
MPEVRKVYKPVNVEIRVSHLMQSCLGLVYAVMYFSV